MWEEKLFGPYKSIQRLAESLAGRTGCSTDNWVIDGNSDGIIMAEWTVNRENNTASNHEAQWKNGVLKLWRARLTVKVILVEKRPFHPQELREMTGMEIV